MPLKFSDKQIVEGLLSREERICNEIANQLFEQNSKPITRLVTRNQGSTEDAEDLFQEVMLAFFRQVWDEKFEQQDSTRISTYLYAVAQNKWLKKLNKDKVEIEHSKGFANKFLKPEPTPIENIIIKEETTFAESAFAKLGRLCQDILKAYYLEEKSMEEIAVIFNFTNAATAKVRKFRCMQKLNNLI